MGVYMTKPDPVITKCECPDPECLGYLVDNLNIRQGRVTLQDAKLVARRKELKDLIPKFQATLRKHMLDAKERDLVAYLSALQRDLG